MNKMTKTTKILSAVLLATVVLAIFAFRAQERAAHEKSAIQSQNGLEELEFFGGRMISRVATLFHPAGPDVPPPPDIEKMKRQGCIADGLLNGHGGDTKRSIKLINRSECYYLHRSIETWLEAPDFEDIAENMEKIDKEEIVFGMFIAEAISTKADQHYPAEDRDFEFSKMCREGSKNFWGEHTCKPSLERSEYRRYVRHITEKAMDLGVQSFMFGQVYFQDSVSEPVMPEVIKEMREYAEFKGMEIIIGAQTNDIEDKEYLQLFDYIEGGVGLATDGDIENGPCFSRWYKKEGDWCWALLWHDRFRSKADHVFVHLDWSGRKGDDMSTFSLMERSMRHHTLTNLHNYFTSQKVGFLLPMLAVLPKENGGCHGKSRKFYSPDNKYSCKDEDVINAILEVNK